MLPPFVPVLSRPVPLPVPFHQPVVLLSMRVLRRLVLPTFLWMLWTLSLGNCAAGGSTRNRARSSAATEASIGGVWGGGVVAPER
jgi:membrane associated rhomboid family serine protease